MSLPSPNLDDRAFQDFVDEAKRLLQHHPLVASQGRKLSKSAGAQASPLTLSDELRATVADVAATYSASAQAHLLRNREC